VKRKIGIVTFHYVDNYGAVLQTWALKKYLNSMPDVHAEIINYVPENYQIFPYERTHEGIEMMQKKRLKYETFLQQEELVTKPMQHSLTGKEYDYYIVGSDQVWNLEFRENVSNEYLFPNLDRDAKRISYAASIGKKISPSEVDLFRQYLNKFSAISVREQSSVQELDALGIKGVDTVVDPTLLLDAEDYETLIKEPDNKPSDFLFFFTYPMGDEVRKYIPFVNNLARENGLSIIHSLVGSPSTLFSNNVGCMMYEGIGEFLWYIRNARAIVTMSYHGVILGRLFGKPTYVIHREHGWGRLEQLDRIIDLNDSIIKNDWPMKKWSISDSSKDLGNLTEWRTRSRSFLKSALEG